MVPAVVVVGILLTTADAAMVQRRRAARYGPLVEVVVAATDLHPGDPLDASTTAVVRWPRTLLPPRVMRPPASGFATMHVPSGHPLATSGTPAPSAVAASLDPTRRALVVPLPAEGTAASEGDLVDLVGVGPLGSGALDGVVTVARGATVVEVDPGRAVVAIGVDEVRATVAAMNAGPVVLVVAP